jgi:hypothetical protein
LWRLAANPSDDDDRAICFRSNLSGDRPAQYFYHSGTVARADDDQIEIVLVGVRYDRVRHPEGATTLAFDVWKARPSRAPAHSFQDPFDLLVAPDVERRAAPG